MHAVALTENEKAAVRATVFHHLSGLVLAPTVKALWDRRVFDLFDSSENWVGLDEVVAHTGGNRGYLRVALRLLTSAGWMKQQIDGNGTKPSYSLTQAGALAL